MCKGVRCHEMRTGMHVPEVVAQAQGWGLPREWVRASGWAWETEC